MANVTVLFTFFSKSHHFQHVTVMVKFIAITFVWFAVDNKRDKLVQAIGTVTTLLLLCIPWIFSTAGALDTDKDDTLHLFKFIMTVQ